MKPKINLIALLVFLFSAAALYAQEQVVFLEETVVTASRYKDSVHRTPANVTVITDKDIKDSAATNIPELLQKKANIHFRTYSDNPSQAQIDIRGFGGDNPYGKVLILLNGRRLNRPDMSSINWLQIPIQQIERIEVVRGASSVLYGDSAVGGVINVITKKGKKDLQTSISSVFGDYNKHIQRAGITGTDGALSFALNTESHSVDGWRDRTASSSKGTGLNFGYDFSDTLRISADASFNKTEYQMPGPLTKTEMKQDRGQAKNDNDDGLSKYIDTGLLIEKFSEDAGDIEVKFVYGSKDIEVNMPSSWSPNQFNKYDINTIGILPKYVLQNKSFGFFNKLIAGVDIYKETLDKKAYGERERQTQKYIAELEKDSLGFYIRNEISLQEDLILGAGLRIEKAEIKGKEIPITDGKSFDKGKTHDGNVFDLGLTKLFGKSSKIFAKFSTLYRYPFLEDQVYYNGNTSDQFIDDLEPEKGKNYEIGGNFSLFDRLNMSLTAFNTDMKDTIAYVGTFPSGKNENIGKTNNKGIEFSISYNKNDISLYANYNYNKTTYENGENDGNQLPLTPNHRVTAGSNIPLFYDIYLSPELQYVSDSYVGGDDKNQQEKLEDYIRYDIHLKYKPKDKNLTIANFSAFLSLKNVFDKEYCTMAYYDGFSPTGYYPSQGREFSGGISFDF